MHPQQRVGDVRRIRGIDRERAGGFGQATGDPVVQDADTLRGAERGIEVAVDHREHDVEGPHETAEGIGAGCGVILDRLRNERMRELQQRRPAAAQKDDRLAIHLPDPRARTEHPAAWIAHRSADTSERGLELGRRHVHAAGIARGPRVVNAALAPCPRSTLEIPPKEPPARRRRSAWHTTTISSSPAAL